MILHMAVKGRVWSEFDIAAMQIFSAPREDKALSYRRLGEMTGMNHTRIVDMERNRNGTPTLTEFLTLCEVFDLKAPGILEQVLQKADDLKKTAVAKPRAQDESDAEDTIKSFSKTDEFHPGLTADIEKSERLEARGGDGR